jgi:betaine reductase
VLAQELEDAGIPTVLITALPTIAANIGVGRILRGVAISHPVGDPSISTANEAALRERILGRAVDMLEADLPRGTIWEVE